MILDENGKELEGEAEGYIAFKKPWPGIMRTVYGNHERFESTYFQRFPGYYMSGDGAKRDADGYLWITGRVDDMLNCSGHLMSTAQVESVLVEHPNVAEAAVVAAPHKVKGECLYCFVTPKDGMKVDDKVKAELKQLVRTKIAPFAMPDFIQVRNMKSLIDNVQNDPNDPNDPDMIQMIQNNPNNPNDPK